MVPSESVDPPASKAMSWPTPPVYGPPASAWGGAPFPDYRAWLPGVAGNVVAAVLGIALLFAGVAAVLRATALARNGQGG